MVRAFFVLILLGCLPWTNAAQRVVSLAPSLSQTMLDLQAQHLLVGVLDAGPLPTALAQVPRVGTLGQLDIEKILTLQPDLILHWPGSVPTRQLQQLQQLGIPIYHADAKSMAELAAQFRQLGEQVGAAQQGRLLEQQALHKLQFLQQRYQSARPWRVFYQLWDSPMYTLGGKQIVTDALQYCGAENIFAHLPALSPQVNLESVLSAEPDLLVLTHKDLRESWPQSVTLPIVIVPDSALERPGVQMFTALELLCQQIERVMEK